MLTKPQSRLSRLVGDLEPVRRDALGHDAEGFGDGGQRLVLVPHLAGVELIALGGRAEELRLFTDGRGNGVRGGLDGVDIESHVDLLVDRFHVRGRSPM